MATCVFVREREREERERERERGRERESVYVKLHACTIDESIKYNLSGHTHTDREGECTHITLQLDLAHFTHFTWYESRAQAYLSPHMDARRRGEMSDRQ